MTFVFCQFQFLGHGVLQKFSTAPRLSIEFLAGQDQFNKRGGLSWKKNPVAWFEIYIQDMNRARKFYESVLNVGFSELKSPEMEMMAFSVKRVAHRFVLGIMERITVSDGQST